MWMELLVVLLAIFIGARIGGAGLGTIAGLGLAVLVFGFGLPPSSPPGQVLAIILAVVTAAATMQAAGGMELLVALAEKALRAKPQYITFVAPAVAYLFTFCSGTGHVAYAILPVIAEVARKAGIRPERPMSISVIASQQAITASPLAAATAGLLALFATSGLTINGQEVTLKHILLICVPSTFLGCMIGAFSVCRMGKDLKDDPEYQKRLASGLSSPPAPARTLSGTEHRNAVGSVAVFLIAAAAIVTFGMFPAVRPSVVVPPTPPKTVSTDQLVNTLDKLRDSEPGTRTFTLDQIAEGVEKIRTAKAGVREPISMTVLIQVVMYAAAGIMMLAFGAKPTEAVKSGIGTAGVVAVISIVGLGWMGSCFFEGNRETIIGGIEGVVKAHPWIFAIGLFTLSVLLFSQAATVAALMPVGIALGMPVGALIAFFPAVNGYFFLPTYGTIVAAVNFDSTGTTRIGKYVLNHSFMRPGLVSTGSALAIGWLISRML